MIIRKLINLIKITCVFAACVFISGTAGAAESAAAKLNAIANGTHRTAEQVARNPSRHPVETLTFFGFD